jgi:hypothetical protein
MLYFQLETFKIQSEKAERILAKMRSDLEEYAKKPEAKQKVIDIRNELIASLLQFQQTANEVTQSLFENYSEARKYRVMYEKLQAENERQYIPPPTGSARQVLRFDSQEQAKKDFPNLF